ncbi:MAG: hypothetical protein ACLT4D_08125 [Blautia faecis]
MEKTRYYVELPPFTGRNVPVGEIAKAIGKDAVYPHGLQKGIFSFGYAIKLENSSEYNYFVQTGKSGKKQVISGRKIRKKNPCVAGKSFSQQRTSAVTVSHNTSIAAASPKSKI